MVFHALTFARSRGETEAEGRSFQHLPRDLANVNALKTMFDRYYCIKTKNICYISRYFLHYFVSPFTDVTRMLFPRTMLVLGQGSTYLVTAAILWPGMSILKVA